MSGSFSHRRTLHALLAGAGARASAPAAMLLRAPHAHHGRSLPAALLPQLPAVLQPGAVAAAAGRRVEGRRTALMCSLVCRHLRAHVAAWGIPAPLQCAVLTQQGAGQLVLPSNWKGVCTHTCWAHARGCTVSVANAFHGAAVDTHARLPAFAVPTETSSALNTHPCRTLHPGTMSQPATPRWAHKKG
jgi:hypothetical protein